MREQNRFKEVLQNFISRYTMISTVMILGVAIMLYAILYFGVLKEMFVTFEEEVEKGIHMEINQEIGQLQYHFSVIEKKTKLLSQTFEEIFQNYDKYDSTIFSAEFDVHENGVFYKTVNNGGASLYYSATTPLTDYVVEKALKTEWADPVMKHLVDSDILVEQAYFNSFDNMNRLYPYIEEVPLTFGPFQEIKEFQFYYKADEIHNPEHEIVWTMPYLDPAGQGWIISCLSPVYNGDFLEGVVGLDIRLKQLIDYTMSLNHLDGTALMLFDESGLIIAMNEDAEQLLGIKEVDEEGYGIITTNILKPTEYNIEAISDKILYNYIDEILNEEPVTNQLNYIVNQGVIEQTKWQFLALTEDDFVQSKLSEIYYKVYKNLFIIVVIMMVMVVGIMIAYKARIKRMAKSVSVPLEEMAVQAKLFSVSGEYNSIESSGIKEIDDLNKEIYIMTKEIKERAVKLLQAQIEHQKAELTIETYYKEAITDELTQLYNRRKIDDVLDSEVKRGKRYRKTFSVILLDIDYFKEINDQYGHQTGDEILKGVAALLRKTVRESDMVSRWGGDEFLIVLVEADIAIAGQIAEKIRLGLVDTVLHQDIKVTTSVGVADFDFRHDDARDVIRKADLALYEAKNRGKNNVVRIKKVGAQHEYI